MAQTITDTLDVENSSSGETTIRLQGDGGARDGGGVRVHDADGRQTVFLDGDFCNLVLGSPDGGGEFSGLYMNNPQGALAAKLEGFDDGGRLGLKDVEGAHDVVSLDGRSGELKIGGGGQDAEVLLRNAGNHETIRLEADASRIVVQDPGSDRAVHVDGEAGDIKLVGGDCAECFDLADGAQDVEPGTVMVVDDDGRLRACHGAYDRRVMGVISGAGDLQPGVVLGQRPSSAHRQPVAVAGTVNCRVDARDAPVAAGDLLTTATRPGHARKATDPQRAFGAVLGKALRPLEGGTGLVPVLVALQ